MQLGNSQGRPSRPVGMLAALAAVALIAFACGGPAADAGGDSAAASARIPAESLVIAGVHLGRDSASVRGVLGSPRSVAREGGGPAGGRPDATAAVTTVWGYEGLVVRFAGDSVSSVVCEAGECPSVGGIRLGMLRSDVELRLGAPDSSVATPQGWVPYVSDRPNCGLAIVYRNDRIGALNIGCRPSAAAGG